MQTLGEEYQTGEAADPRDRVIQLSQELSMAIDQLCGRREELIKEIAEIETLLSRNGIQIDDPLKKTKRGRPKGTRKKLKGNSNALDQAPSQAALT